MDIDITVGVGMIATDAAAAAEKEGDGVREVFDDVLRRWTWKNVGAGMY